jgi:hypothetical protein
MENMGTILVKNQSALMHEGNAAQRHNCNNNRHRGRTVDIEHSYVR